MTMGSPLAPPVPRARQNDYRDERVSDAAELATWERVTAQLVAAVRATAGVELPPDDTQPITMTNTTGAALDGTHAITPPFQLLGDDPTRRRAVITSFSTSQIYIARTSEAFQGFDARVKLLGLNAAPMPGMAFIEDNMFIIYGSRPVWVMQIALATVPTWVSAMAERATRAGY